MPAQSFVNAIFEVHAISRIHPYYASREVITGGIRYPVNEGMEYIVRRAEFRAKSGMTKSAIFSAR
jgi:hypothetical protein